MSYIILILIKVNFYINFNNIIRKFFLVTFFIYFLIFLFNLLYYNENLINRLVFNPISGNFHGIEIYVFLALFFLAFINPKNISILDFLILSLLFSINIYLSNRLASIVFIIYFTYLIFTCKFNRFNIFFLLTITIICLYFFDIYSSLIDRFASQGLGSQRFDLAILGYDLILNNYSISADWMYEVYSVTSFHFYLLDLFRLWQNYFILLIAAILLVTFFLSIKKNKNLNNKFFILIYYLIFFFSTPTFELPSIIMILTSFLLISSNENFNYLPKFRA